MNFFAEGLAERGIKVARFEFPYMAKTRDTGKKGPSNPQPVLMETWRKVIAQLGAQRLVIGGKSMGGRIASMVADEAGVAGLVCLGYPFHPVGKSEQLRVTHLETLTTPALILQGERDPFGSKGEVAAYKRSSAIKVHWLADGDHDLKPRKSSGRTSDQNWAEALGALAAFVEAI